MSWLRSGHRCPTTRTSEVWSGRPGGNAAGSCAQRTDRTLPGTAERRGHRGEQTGTAEHELLAAERHAALREAFLQLPPCDQQLIALLTQDPPAPYAKISSSLGIPVGSIGPTRGRCLDRLRRHPALAALINAETDSAEVSCPGKQ